MRLMIIVIFLTGCTVSATKTINNNKEDKSSVTLSGKSNTSITVNN